MEINGLYQDIPRIYSAIAEWGAVFFYGYFMKKRWKGLPYGLVSLLFLGIQVAWMVMTDNVRDSLWLVCMLVSVALMYAYLYLVRNAGWQEILYECLKAFLFAEFIASLEWQLECYVRSESLQENVVMSFCFSAILLVIVFGISFVALYYFDKEIKQEEYQMRIGYKELWTTGLIVAASFFLSNLSFVYENTPFSSSFAPEIFNIRTLIDLGGLAIFFAYQSRMYELGAEKELQLMETMLKNQYDNYRNYQETIELINVKYHDLKHQIMGLRAEVDPEKRSRWLDALEEELERYQPEQQTGNQVLDAMIDGKMATIRNNKMKFTCVADGSLLQFIHVTDICTIFGNALDNAIENVILIPDEEKRLIHMTVAKRKQFVYIDISNYCEQPLKLKNGYPVTTKANKKNHGYGIKSICYTVGKYGGSVDFDVRNHMFELKILIPWQEN